MDRLIIIEPRDLIFRVEVGERASAILTLRNAMHTMPVAFSVQQSSLRSYTVKPTHGIIRPLGVAVVEVVLSPLPELPLSAPYSEDKFIIKSVVVPGESEPVNLDWFTAKKKLVFSDHGIRVIFVGCGILRRLITDGSVEDVREVLEFDGRLVNSTNDDGQSPLHVALQYGRPELVPLLLKFGADIGVQSSSGRTVLHEAVWRGDMLVLELLLARRSKSNIDVRNSFGWTALHMAVMSGNIGVVQLLLQNDVDVNAVVPDGRTALHFAVEKGKHECLRILLEAGADTGMKDVDGNVPLHKAVMVGDRRALDLLLKYGATTEAINKEGKMPSDLACMSDHRRFSLLEELSLGDKLRSASRKGKLRDVHQCVSRGAIIDGEDEHGWTALHRAAFKGHIAVVRALVSEGADLDCQDDAGYTPLHCAVEAGQKEVIKLLLKHGAQVNVSSVSHCTALDLATSFNNLDIAQVLRDWGALDCKVEKKMEAAVAVHHKLDDGVCQCESATLLGTAKLSSMFTPYKPAKLLFANPDAILTAPVF